MELDSLTTDSVKMALRFRKSQARILRALAERAAQRDLPGAAVGLFQNAAEAAGKGEPLIVICTQPAEAQAMAQAFAMYGVVPPTVETLSGFLTG